MEYPTDRTCMASIEIAFEKRISQALSSAQDSLGSKRDKGMNNPKGKGVNTITECSPFDQALASLLLMNGGRKLKGAISRRLQRVCYILESLLCNGTEMPSSLIAGTPGSATMGDGWARVADRVLIEALEENETSATSVILRFSK